MQPHDEVLTRYRTIAVVGLSPRIDRPSHQVARYMQAHGYRIVPINPVLAGQKLLGETCYASLTAAASALRAQRADIEIVDCFRRSEQMEPIADEAIVIAAKCLWMQIGIVSAKAAARAAEGGLIVVMNRCIKIDHMQLVQVG